MTGIFSFLKSLFHDEPQIQLSPQELRQAFRKKYTSFRHLLTANNNALQAMAELEKLYYGQKSYRMAHIRTKITAITVNVYKIIRNLRILADGRYDELEKIFDKITVELDTLVERTPAFREGPMVLPLSEIGKKDRDLVGDKMANLGEVGRIPGLLIPPGFAITASGTRTFLTHEHIAEINRQLQVLDLDNYDEMVRCCNTMQKLVTDSILPANLEELIKLHYSRLERETGTAHCLVALRSSALGEDSAGISFAGLYRTVLNVDHDRLIDAYKQVIASKYGARAIAYRRQRGYRHQDIEMCVGCIQMVDALISGVAYSLDPGDPDSNLIRINATSGIAKGVVDGTCVTDLYLLGRQAPYPMVYSELRQAALIGHGEGPSLTYGHLKKLAEAALALENHFGAPQDVEWSFDHQGRLFILQSRPLQMKRVEEETVEEESDEPVMVSGENAPLLFGGICAADGISCGEIFKVNSPEDMRLFPKDAVLAVAHPLPDWAPLLNKAVAIIAESGSDAGHLATVAREFGIPALFSLPNIMNNLQNGELITVSATNRAIYRGRREDLLRQRKVRRDVMAGSPVQRILTEALQYITPLNLNDPTSQQFKASWCETLHDITRFCHEKSITEMFSFGENYHFDQGTARRLVGDVPLEWWVIDLADGLRPEVSEESKTIRIEDIVSTPMLAIWKGISAYPWQGPPPVSMKGFGSIIFQSTMRPELDPTVATKMTAKNYFLISKNFCNLSVRLGYHYALIEAYLSDLLTESYVTFRFKGGAADLQRKAVRAKLLADVLQHYDFRVELRSDALLARIKKESMEFLEQRLQILGYLTLHARQIDMVMDQKHTVQKYKNKFYTEIDAMLAAQPLPKEASDGPEQKDPAC